MENKWIGSRKFRVIQDFRDQLFLNSLYKSAGGWDNVFQTSQGIDNQVTFEVPSQYSESVRQCLKDWGVAILSEHS